MFELHLGKPGLKTAILEEVVLVCYARNILLERLFAPPEIVVGEIVVADVVAQRPGLVE